MAVAHVLVAALLQAAPSPGLVLEAADGERTVHLVVPAPAFALQAGESVHPSLDPRFTARWTGLLRIVRAGRYAFAADAKVLVDGRDARGGALDLEPGDHALSIDGARPPRFRLDWSSDHFPAEPVPSSVLFHRERTAALEASLRAERGRELVVRFDCRACHELPSNPGGRGAPALGGSGARWTAAWLENPRRFRADAAMPALPLDAAARADVAAYLAGLAKPAPAAPPTDRFRVARGEDLFGKAGCAQCHSGTEHPLAGLGSKVEAGALAQFLLDPLKTNPSGRMPDLLLKPDEAAVIAEWLVRSRNPDFEREVPGGDPARGKALVQSQGCLGCHTLEDGGRPPNTFRQVPLGAGAAGKGCLAPEPGGRAARYGLTAEERGCIEEFLRQPPDRARAPGHALSLAVRSFRCAACHAIDDQAPVGLKDAAPPPLTGAGTKMRTSWLEEVLLRKKRVRPWMDLRMPHFGETNVAFLPRAFAVAAGAEPEAPEPPAPPGPVREGVRLAGAGEGGLSCISCHDFKDRIALATRGPDLTEMHARMRPDWFRRWLRDPGRIQPGTAMPTFFAGVPEAEAARRMDLLWAALSAGREMPTPAGYTDPRSFYVAVGEEAVVLRTFMPDASARAVAVGLPGGTSYCFDAEDCRLLYAWRGDFLDLSPAWGGRGGQAARILGTRFYAPPAAFPLRIGDPAKEPRPVFKGYEIVDKAPEFLYVLDGVDVRERITAAPDGPGLVRRYRLGRVEGEIRFLAHPGATFTSPDGEFKEGILRLPGGPSPAFSVTLRP